MFSVDFKVNLAVFVLILYHNYYNFRISSHGILWKAVCMVITKCVFLSLSFLLQIFRNVVMHH